MEPLIAFLLWVIAVTNTCWYVAFKAYRDEIKRQLARKASQQRSNQ